MHIPRALLTMSALPANAGRAHFGHRLAVVGQSTEADSTETCLPSAPARSGTRHCKPAAAMPPIPRMSFSCSPVKASQYNDMGRELYATEAGLSRRPRSLCTDFGSLPGTAVDFRSLPGRQADSDGT